MDPYEASQILNSQGQAPVMFAARNNYHKALNCLIDLNSNQINQEDNN